ncbi:DUF4362 domain-containing protein [Micromonospora sp. NBC_01796]|uniref:DUF4362 domain-containing protein n=1 Tax=Micromonospora sp. NBC_01796 TaxID=2975987 RepID=UPI002DD99B03|nr:DUF4362 domain-containing protein [Micromonospora sp. NBC_01796]WSA88936.1 DUF4362 domain-containing protein [Micromonospora sp. NBC_01796]
MKRVLYLAVAAVALSACGGPKAPATDVSASAVAGSGEVTDCGTFVLSQGEGLSERAVRCFVDAVQAGRPVRLKQTSPTTEGDPIITTYEAGVDGRVEIVTDSRQDNFGPQIISRHTCTGPTPRPGMVDFAQCSEPTPIES